ncbi:MAG: type I methionyl aminopeptidase [Rickettsiales bacterium]|jgi:methionyl aminopeptidase|nr:type I methionyl aminopeptidase [Rickettsiales bacterium]
MIYSKQDFEGLRIAGRKAAETLDFIAPYVVEGVSTLDLDRLVAEHTKKLGGICACLGFEGYPKSCCISRNDVVCHGIPSKHEFLADGDIVNVDVTTIFNGYYGDTSRMYMIGEVAPRARELASVAYEAMMSAIGACRPGVKFGEIGRIISALARAHGFSVVEDFCGHGIGTSFHESPNVLHYENRESDLLTMSEGMVFTIEPMINTGAIGTVIDKSNGWTARTVDGGLSAQWEHTIGITESGYEIFTKNSAF